MGKNGKYDFANTMKKVKSENFSSLDWYFSQILLPSMIYLYIITPYIRMLDSDWLIAVIYFFKNSGLA
jgi:hypothetical protein